MNKAKEKLIVLVKQFHALGEQVLIDVDENEENVLNDKLIEAAISIEEASVNVFDKKIKMDFGMVNLVFHDNDKVIKYIRDYEKE